MTGIELLRKYAETGSLTLLTCRKMPDALGKECDDFRSCNDCHRFVCNAIADQIEREIKEAVTDWSDDEDDAFEDMRGARTGIEMLRSYVHNARVYARNLYINYVSDINAVQLYETLRVCLQCLDEIANRIERETLMRPLFEDGEPVQFGDEYEAYGHLHMVEKITFFKDRWIVSERFDNSNVSGGPLKRPEPEDSWEQIEEDARKFAVFYCDERGLLDPMCNTLEGDASTRHCTDCGCSCEEKMALDLVRRCKALAGIEEDQ